MSAANDATESAWPAILTWRAHDASRMESARVQLSGNRIKAYGRIVAAAAADTHPAFSASYDLVTDESGATKRLSLSVTLAERDRQLSIARDEENMWLITDHQGQSRGSYEGALDVDVVFSPFFNALPIRRTGLYRRVDSVTLPVVYVNLPDLTVSQASISYSSPAWTAPRASSCTRRWLTPRITVDADGFILDYPGLAARI